MNLKNGTAVPPTQDGASPYVQNRTMAEYMLLPVHPLILQYPNRQGGAPAGAMAAPAQGWGAPPPAAAAPPAYAEGQIVNGHMFTRGQWVPVAAAPPPAVAAPAAPPAYVEGQVVNGHRLTGGQWVPVAAGPAAPPPAGAPPGAPPGSGGLPF